MADKIHQLVEQVLQMLLAGDDPVLGILRRQLEVAKRGPLEKTGVGFFIHFDVPQEATRVPGNPSITFADVVAEIEGLQYGAGFTLFVDNGILSMLEGYTYDEQWPEQISKYELKYISGEKRNVTAHRQQ